MVLTLLTAVYILSAVFLTIFALGSIALLLTYLRHRRDLITTAEVTEWPTIAVQLPVYNELYVVERLIQAVAQLDYPHDKLTIQILDDSTDATSDVIARAMAPHVTAGLNIIHVRRTAREGYKAGALAYGLSLLDVEMVAVLDADFVPAPDFLKRTVPSLVNNPQFAMVQTRWGHLNSDESVLTKGQALALDGHFVIEQTARSRSGLLMNFNGSGGVWRVRAIEEAGGWCDSTLTEDLDLSYRAQLIGWRFLYLPDVVVPGELPPAVSAYKQQQARWAKGGTQCLRRYFWPLWCDSRLTIIQRLMATLHLSQYLVHVLILLIILLTPPLLIAHALQDVELGGLGIAGLGPPIAYVISQRALYGDWRRRILALPAVVALGTGLAWSNSRAVISAFLTRHKDEFKRTPKFAQKRAGNPYALISGNFVWELALSLYTAWGTYTALRIAPAYAPYLLLYAVAFGVVAAWSMQDSLIAARSR